MSDQDDPDVATGNGAPSEAQGNFFDLLTPPVQVQPEAHAAPDGADNEKWELAELQDRLTRTLKQVRKGKLAATSGIRAMWR